MSVPLSIWSSQSFITKILLYVWEIAAAEHYSHISVTAIDNRKRTISQGLSQPVKVSCGLFSILPSFKDKLVNCPRFECEHEWLSSFVGHVIHW